MLDLRILILFGLLVVKTSALRTGKDVKRFQEEDQEEQTFESLEHYFASRLQEDKNTKSDPIKGQLILKCPFGVFKSSKKTNEIFPKISALTLEVKSKK